MKTLTIVAITLLFTIAGSSQTPAAVERELIGYLDNISKFGSYGEMNKGWSGDDVKGFAKIFGNQTAIYLKVNEEAQ